MRTLVIAPHPDDEVLGVGGTLFRRKQEGASTAWLIMTSISVEAGWSEKVVNERAEQIKQISQLFEFDAVYQLDFKSRELDQISKLELVNKISNVFQDFQPEELFLPHYSDIHSDHRITFDAALSCTKWFRFPCIKRILAYETLSETDFGLVPELKFNPNVFIDIDRYLENKLSAMSIYSSEIGTFPFPRSVETITALAKLRGSASGYKSAEAFELLKERQS
jgi:LmbE family N-acetylglucosaminyl deacetylase